MQFVDETFGEWYGYLNRDGSINMDFKGGPFKGIANFYTECFIQFDINHVDGTEEINVYLITHWQGALLDVL